MRIRDIAQIRMRYGYFRIYILLRREGWIVDACIRETLAIYVDQGIKGK
ncbi:hypothetical protein EDF57_1064 [Novosphingobium sp. PhB55]|nr:hypothetical protein EDF57_1064 [Novosphingobium sp. PhB55]